MSEFLNSNTLTEIGKLILRLTLGILILFHGMDKLVHGIGPIQEMVTGRGLPGFLAYGVYLGEILGPLLLVAGFHARIGAGLIAINMVIAILLVHTGDLLGLSPHGGWRLELQGMYLFTALSLMLMGPGRFSLKPH
ncbi:MAG: DoxX family protein [Anaerolineales bacterium]